MDCYQKARLTEPAYAKLNLCLHIGPKEANGYHALKSLVAFCEYADLVSLDETHQGLVIDGPFAKGLSANEDNLINRAKRLFADYTGFGHEMGVNLTKNLPIASGIGGGSADAAAILRLLQKQFTPDMAFEDLSSLARQIGADGPMCLRSRSSLASGYGEILRDCFLPSMACVLINPLITLSTRDVYDQFDQLPIKEDALTLKEPHPSTDVTSMLSFLQETRNDLQGPAIELAPVISEIIEIIRAQPSCLLARMSGSGATVFALCQDQASAEQLAAFAKKLWPGFWVIPTRLI